jgi:hypothetical protein
MPVLRKRLNEEVAFHDLTQGKAQNQSTGDPDAKNVS